MTTDTPNPKHDNIPSKRLSRRNRLTALCGAIVLVLLVIGGIVIHQHSITHKVDSDQGDEYLEGRKYEAIVWITSDGYLPSTLRIHRDTVVFWENHDKTKHRIMFTPGEKQPLNFDQTHDISSDQQYGARFMSDGTYHYHDLLNQKLNGTIIVSGN